MARLTKTEAFAKHGAVLQNTIWSWSALKQDASGVVVTAWRDHFDWTSRPPVYDGRPGQDRDPDSLGNRERLLLLERAVAEFGGIADVVLLTAVDPAASPRSIEDCFLPNFRFRISTLDHATGGFTAEVVPKGG